MDLALNHTYISQALNLAVQQLQLEKNHAFLKRRLHHALSCLVKRKMVIHNDTNAMKKARQISCKQLPPNEYGAGYYDIMKIRCMFYKMQIPRHLPNLGVDQTSSGMMEAYSQGTLKEALKPAVKQRKPRKNEQYVVMRYLKKFNAQAATAYLSPKAQFGRKSFNFN